MNQVFNVFTQEPDYTGEDALVDSVNGQTGAVVLDTDDIAEGTSLYFTDARAIASPLTGLSVAGSAIVSTDTILQAFGKAQNQINALVGGVNYQGTWNATTNSPAIVSGVGTKGYYYVVSVAGSTNIDGITDWKLGDWIIFNGSTWQKVDNTDAVISVNGYTGIVTLAPADIGLGEDLTATDASLSFSGAYDGTVARTVGINYSHAGTWVGQQTFSTNSPIFGTMTAGSVLFAGTSGLLSQDNTNFNYVSNTLSLRKDGVDAGQLIINNGTATAQRVQIAMQQAGVSYAYFGLMGTTNPYIIGAESVNDFGMRADAKSILFSIDSGATVNGGFYRTGYTTRGNFYISNTVERYNFTMNQATTHRNAIQFWTSGTYKGELGTCGATNTMITGASADDFGIRPLSGNAFRVSFGGSTSMLLANASGLSINTNAVPTSWLNVAGADTKTVGSFNQASPGTSITTPYPAFEVVNSNTTTNNFATISFADQVSGASYALFGGRCSDHVNNYGELYWWIRGASNTGVQMNLNTAGLSVGNTTTLARARLDVVETTASALVGYFTGTNTGTSVTSITGLSLVNSHNTTNNWVGIGLGDTVGTASVGFQAQLTDRTNHYGDAVIATRDSDGYVERMRVSKVTTTFIDAMNFVFGTSTGSKFGTTTSQKIGFYGVTPVAQGASIADASGGVIIDSEARTALNDLLARIRAVGLIAV